MNPLLLKMSELVVLVGLSRTTIEMKEAEGTFPKRKRLSPRRYAWDYDEVRSWVKSLGTL
jgi:prophage regulatory protein